MKPLCSLPLCVDLDDSLLCCDSTALLVKKLVVQKPWCVVWFCYLALFKSWAGAKAWAAQRITLDVSVLPYRVAFLDFLKEQHKQGRPLYLVSASDRAVVDAVADHVGLFTHSYGSDGVVNLKAAKKAAFIQEHIAPEFVYAGDSHADLSVWQKARGAILCGQGLRFKDCLDVPIEAVFD